MTILEHSSVELKSHKKICDNDEPHKQDISCKTTNVHKTQVASASKDAKGCFFQCRYLVVLMQFLAFCQINCLRQVTGVSIVAMVNNSKKVQLVDNFNSSTLTCPISTQEIEMNIVPEVKGEFDWSPSLQGYILSASFLGFVLTQMPGGMLAEAFGAKYVIAIGLFISSVCHFISPFVSRKHSYLMLFAQLVRGMGQGLIPAAHYVVASNWFPRNERGLLNTLVLSGYAGGALVGGSLTGVICSSEYLGGWPFSYYFFGVLGVLLSILFHFVLFESPGSHPNITAAELNYIEQDQETDMSKKRPPTPWRQILCSVPVHALTIALFPQFWVGIYCLVVQPTFLGTILHVNMQENGFLSSVPFVLQVLFSLLASCVSNWLQRRNYVGVDPLRKGFGLLCYVGHFVGFMGMYAAGCNKWLSVGFNTLQNAIMGLAFAGPFTVAVDMSPRYAGSVMGLVSTISNISGFVLPVIVGLLTNEEQTLNQWNKIFFMSAGMSISAAIIFCVFGSAEIQPWNFETKEEYENYKSTCKVKKAKIEELRNNVDATCHI